MGMKGDEEEPDKPQKQRGKKETRLSPEDYWTS